VLACIWTKPAPAETGKPMQKWCPIKEGIPGEKVTYVFDVIDYPIDDEDFDVIDYPIDDEDFDDSE
jgi:hypothetical protein